jgi:SNF2 family DNA or RNA helicase
MITLWSHQKNTVRECEDRDHFALFFEPGCGKTLTAITILSDKVAKYNRKIPTLILCPLIVCENWKRELARALPTEWYKGVEILDGTANQRAEKLINPNKWIFITNHEALIMKPLYQRLISRRFKLLIVDESHRFKNPTAKRTKALTLLSDTCQFKYILTGSPVLQNELDLFSQFRILDPKIFGENFYSFRARYFEDKNSGMPKQAYYPNWQIKPSARDQIAEILNQYAHVVKKEDVLDLPPLVRTKIFVEPTSEQAKHYTEMERDFITSLENLHAPEIVVATTTLTKLLRLQQICSGVLKTDQRDRIINCGKQAALKELLTDIGSKHQVIIWTSWVPTYFEIRKVCVELDLSYEFIVGETKQADRQQAQDDFNAGKIQIIIANQAAAGVGINLQAASYMIYYSKTYNLEHDIQSEARNYRAGSERHEKITRIDLITKDTIEEEITESLWNKQRTGMMLLELAKRYQMKQAA